MAANRARVFNTYLTGETKEERQRKLEEYGEVSAWYIGQEETGSHGMPHIQLTFGFKNQRHLNALQKKLPDGANIQITENPKSMIKYCSDENKRDGELYINGDVPNFDRKKHEELNLILQGAEDLGSYEDAMNVIKEHDLSYFINNQKKLAAYFGNVYAMPDKALYSPEQFNIKLIDFPENKTVIFVGPTRIGKTQFALAHFKSPIIIRGKQDWCRFQADTTDGVVLDDIAFRKWVPETLLHTMECETAYTQDVKYGAVRIPAGLKKIVCINSMETFWPENILDCTKEAIEARIVIYQFDKPLYNRKRELEEIGSSSDNGGPSKKMYQTI